MQFQWYDPDTGAPVISIANYGINFSSGAIDVLGKPIYIKIGIDSENNILGIKPLQEEEDGVIKFISRERQGNVRITSKDFIRFIKSKLLDEDIIEDSAKKYIAKWDKDNEILIINLNDPIQK
ncbi:hypothetical protein BX659_1369 [Orenia metallireducens]|uniref:Uncharacterized protein n=2 Tax=Orenia TaxID=46468 RepID=A0A285ICF0_9FIRM|nr:MULTISPECIES: hypothetical protein [Orenia]PRX20130.1 hypothetical protein BX659_1369 [Orenia metallireducens]TDX48864.1 hypothetical protein C7959_12543 [Orenia marismortui]SNY45659.1 hypothetical protein SAMN06265827_1399 [Orenia metallireducens]